MTPHPLATWVQMSVSAQREANRRQRGRTVRRVLLERRAARAAAEAAEGPAASPARPAQVPVQRSRPA